MTLPEATGLFLAFLARLITGAQGHWHGCPPKAEQRIYFANHQSHFDWVLIWAALPRDLLPQHLRRPYNFEQHLFADSSRIRKELRYSERIPVDEALRRTIEWEIANPPEQIDPAQFSPDPPEDVTPIELDASGAPRSPTPQ